METLSHCGMLSVLQKVNMPKQHYKIDAVIDKRLHLLTETNKLVVYIVLMTGGID